jgi:tRNA (guanine-N7-)-methyltransferase
MSYANSRIPTSAQPGPHEHLPVLLQRHFSRPFRKPYAPHNVVAFEASLAGWDRQAPLILDAGCGVGLSTIELARRHPDHWVIGVDRSDERLQRRKPYPESLLPKNMVLVRADLVDYWRLLHDAGIRLARHYLLYPNPWPKIGHLARRWHAHPVFPSLLQLGGVLECRTNWRVYIDELAAALKFATGILPQVETLAVSRPLSAFERKYHDSGQPLYRLELDLQQYPPRALPVADEAAEADELNGFENRNRS